MYTREELIERIVYGVKAKKEPWSTRAFHSINKTYYKHPKKIHAAFALTHGAFAASHLKDAHDGYYQNFNSILGGANLGIAGAHAIGAIRKRGIKYNRSEFEDERKRINALPRMKRMRARINSKYQRGAGQKVGPETPVFR